VFWLDGGTISTSYGMYVGLMMIELGGRTCIIFSLSFVSP